MKIQRLLLVGSLFFSTLSFGQVVKKQMNSGPLNATSQHLNQTLPSQNDHSHDGPHGEYCKSHELNQAHYEQRGLLQQFNESALQGAQNVSAQPILKTPGTNTISVIFHVVHNPNNPAENVSNATIMSIYNDISEDFQLLNADASQARSAFGFTPADANINFCLATQDPNGNPLAEVGVVRVATTEDWYDSDNGEENKMKAAATGGSQIWDRNQYLNVWICDITNGANSGTAGYAYRPTTNFLPSSNIDGIVIDYNLGVGGNVLTHEIGHYLGLDHTWGGSGGCTNDDGFGDTPQTAGPSFNYAGSCSGNQTTCGSTQTQYENYMDYSNCTVMFTQDQADYMLSILTGIRNSLLLSPGCDPVDAPPVVDFSGTPIPTIPVGGTVDFTSITTNAPTSWTWDFGGGAPASTLENPSATFNTAGLYTVTHTATNAFGTGTETKTDYINVVSPATGTACDTLRNWAPDSSFTYYNAGTQNGAWGTIPGHNALDLYGNGSSVENTLQYAEQFSYVGTAEVRRVIIPFFTVTDVAPTGGSITLKVYDNDNGTDPGTVLASETVLLADLNAGNFNEIDFTTPASVTGDFFVGMELQYDAAQDTILMALTGTAPGATESFFMEMDTYGWLNSGLLGITESIAMDVLLSNGDAPMLDVTILGDTTICKGSQVEFNAAGSSNVTDYFWYQIDDPITQIIDQSTAPAVTFNFADSGDYQVLLFGDGSCRTAFFEQAIRVNDSINATVTPTATTCGNNNGTIVVSGATGGNGNFEYSLDGNNWQTAATFDNLTSGDYDVYVRTPGNGCDRMYTVNVGASTPFNATAAPGTAICPGGNADITASGGTAYQWFDGATALAPGATVNVSPAATTQYNCIVTDASGCESNVFATITVYESPAVPTISANGSTTICQGETVDLTSSYPTGNAWNDPSNSTGSTISISDAGSYEVTYTDGNGCTSTSAPTVITVNTPVTIAEGAGSSNPTACQSATGSIQITGSGTGNISWTGIASGSANSVTLPYSISGLAAGSYNITMVDANGCTSNILSASLTDPNAPAIPTISASGATTFCDGNSVDLTSSYATGNVWTNTAGTQTISVTQSGSYSVTHTDGNGCSSSSAPVVITVNSNPSAPTITPAGATSVCAGETVTLNSSQGTGNTWSVGGNTQSIDVSSSQSGITVTYTDANGCSATSAPIDVVVNPLPTAPTITASGSTAICAGQTVTLTSSETTGNSWSNGESTQSIVVSTATPGITVTHTDANGCSATSAPIDVTASNGPTVDAGADVSVCEGENVTLNGSGASTYAWDNGVTDGESFAPTATTTYTVTGTDASGCTGTDMVTVTVNTLPNVTMSVADTLCVNHNDAPLNGQPAGGTYFGVGVVGDQFSPGTAGVGTFQITYDYTDGNGCGNTAVTTITVDGCASIEDIESTDVLVFPNPATNQLTISVDGQFAADIVDARGRKVANVEGTNTTNLDVSAFEMGVYFVNVKAGAVNKTVRIVKQ